MAHSVDLPHLRAAQYVRMSSEHQRYSIENQKAAIAAYASDKGYDIVATYADAGKSGLSLKGRDALKQLLSDALSPNRIFDTILILDVSRWGRFQDPDQAGHYEFICRQAGVNVVYCTEPFDNDLSSVSAILKQLKRVMAAEFSRDLSTKLARAHRQQAGLGFKQGGQLIYGFRRQLRGKDGNIRGLLGPGEYKALSTDRVVIVPGPPEELAVIRRMFNLFVGRKLSACEVARILQSEGIPSKDGAAWSRPRVVNVLRSEYCIGVYAYNRTSTTLQQPTIQNPEAEWTRTETMPPVVPIEVFRKAQKGLTEIRSGRRYGTRYMLDALRRLLKKEGRLSTTLLGGLSGTPTDAAYREHFGSMYEAFRRVGYEPPGWQGRLGRREVWSRDEMVVALRKSFAEHGHMSLRIMLDDPNLPSPALVRNRFGSLLKAYEAAELPVMSRSEVQKTVYMRHCARETAKPGGGRFRADGALLRPKFSSEEIIAGLKRLLQEHGYLSGTLITGDPKLPSVGCIIKRFGPLMDVYPMVGWAPTHHQLMVAARSRRHGA